MDSPHEEDMEVKPRSACRLDFDLQEECHLQEECRTPERAHVGLAKSDASYDTDYSAQSDVFSESCDLHMSTIPKDSREAERDLVPKIDMEFESEKEAYDFYTEYGEVMGFSVRKSTVRKLVDGKVRKRVFCCNQEGYKDTRRRKTPPMKPRASWRSGCLARMVIIIQPNGKYRVTEFEGNHNHIVASLRKGHMVKSQRRALGRRYKELCCNFVKIAARAAQSEEAFNIVTSYSCEILQEVEESLKRTLCEGYTSTATQGTVTNSFASGHTKNLPVESTDAFCELGVNVIDEAICQDDNDTVSVDNGKPAKMVKGIKRKEKDKACGCKIKCAIEGQSKKNPPQNELPLAPQNAPPIQFTQGTTQSTVWGIHASGVNPTESQPPKGHHFVPSMFPPPIQFKYWPPDLNIYQHSITGAKLPLNSSMYKSGVPSNSQQYSSGRVPPVQEPLASCFFRQSVGSSTQLNQEGRSMNRSHEEDMEAEPRSARSLDFVLQKECHTPEHANVSLGKSYDSNDDMEAEPRSARSLDFVLQECCTPEHANVSFGKSHDSNDTNSSARSDDFSESCDLPRSSTPKDSIEADRDLIPKIDMEFESEKEAYDFYAEYGEVLGFSVRKSTVRKLVDGKVRKRVFCCNQEGYKDTRRRKTPPVKPRPSWRSGCLARMVIIIQPNGKYRVTEFEENHNHNVVTPKGHMLNSQKRDVGRRYKELCGNFVKIAEMAAQSEELFNIVAGHSYKIFEQVEKSLKRTFREGNTSTVAQGTVTDSFASGHAENLRVEGVDAFCELGVTDEAIRPDDNDMVSVDNSKHAMIVRDIKRKEDGKASCYKIKCAIEGQSKKNRPRNELPLAPRSAPLIQFAQGLHGSKGNPTESQPLNGHYMVPCIFSPPIRFKYHQPTNLSICQHSFPSAKQPVNSSMYQSGFPSSSQQYSFVGMPPPVQEPLAPCYFRQSVGSSSQLRQDRRSIDRPQEEEMEAEPQSPCRMDVDLQEECRTPEHARYGLAKTDDSDDTDYSAQSDESCGIPRFSPPKDSIETERDPVPKIDMEFESEKGAYDFYNEYGRLVGFNIRKSKVCKLVNGKVSKRVFCCNQEGFKDTKRRKTPPKKPRASWRSGCLARMVIAIQPNGKYRVTEFEGNHNHNVVTPRNGHMLESQRTDLGRRCRELCRDLLKIAARAAQSEEVFNIVAGHTSKLFQEVEESLKQTHRAQGIVTGNFASGNRGYLCVENGNAFFELGASVTDEVVRQNDDDRVNVDNHKLSKIVRGIKRKEGGKASVHRIKDAIERRSKKKLPRIELPLAPRNIPIQSNSLRHGTTQWLHGSGVIPTEPLSGHYTVPCMFPPPVPPFKYQPLNLSMYQHNFSSAKQPLNCSLCQSGFPSSSQQ